MDFRMCVVRLLLLICAGLWQSLSWAQALGVEYRCDAVALSSGVPRDADGWSRAPGGQVPVDRDGHPCWVRIGGPPNGLAFGPELGLSFADLHVQRVDIALFSANGRALGQANRLGASRGALVTGTRAVFMPDGADAPPYYARLMPVPGIRIFPGFSNLLQVEAVVPGDSLRAEQRTDLLNLSGAVFLMTSALFAIVFGIALRDLNYGLYAVYAGLQAVTIFSKSGLAFVLDTGSVLWLNAWAPNYLVGVLSVLLSVRFGRFTVHSPRTARVAYGVALVFLLLIPLHYLAPSVGTVVVFVLVPLHFAVLLSGNWRGWRLGERGCGILLLGLSPIAVYWLTFVLYIAVLRAPMPSDLALGSTFDFVRTLVLPMAFYYGICDRTMHLQRATARLVGFDTLTELHNREGIRQHGQDMIDADLHPWTLMINIERFHAINETLGPQLGDQVLKETGKRLLLACKNHPRARVGRMHADQFCVLFPDMHSLQSMRTEIERHFNHPAEVQGQAVDISLSVGVARPGDPGMDMAQLLRNAEIALDAGRAKHTNWLEYRVDLESSKRADLDLLSELKRAVEQDELRLYLQPKVRLADGAVHSAEALVRWMHPRRGLIPPGEFVPFAEKTGRVTLLTRWVLKAAMEMVRQRRALGRPLQISVNLSTFDLAEVGFAERVAAMALEIGACPSDIRLEMTESGAMQDPGAALEVMIELRDAGFSLSIDDFGTGYSSLAYLQKMPVVELKVDRSFVYNVKAGSDGASLLDSTIAIGHRLGLSVVGEGAENAQEWALLRSLGCDYAQGWFAAKAMPMEEFDHWCADHTPFLPESVLNTPDTGFISNIQPRNTHLCIGCHMTLST